MTPAAGYAQMKDSGIPWIGRIPSNWVVKRIKNHFRIITGNGFPVELQGRAEGDYPVCKASDISNASKIICKAANYIQNDMVNSQRFNIIPAGSILLPKIGEAMKKNSRAICAMDCCVDNNCQGLVPLHFNSTYGYYLLSCIDMRWFDNAGTIPCVNNQKLKDCKIPCPDVREQTAIAAYLDTQCAKIDEIIAEAKASIEDYKKWKASIIYEAVTKGLDPNVEMKDSGTEWVGEIPVRWTTIANKYVMHKEKRICEKWENQDVLSLTMNGVIVRDILNPVGKMPATFDGYQFAYSGELLMCLFDIDVTPRCVGRVLDNGVTSPAYSCFQLNSNADLGYFYYYYLMVDNTKELLHLAKNLRHSFTEEQLGMLKVPLPPIDEQSTIATYLDAQCAKIDELSTEKQSLISDLEAYKKALIYEVVTGKRRVC